MLRRLNNKTIVGDGFRIFVPDVHCVIYNDAKYAAKLEIEGGMTDGQIDWLVYGLPFRDLEGKNIDCDTKTRETILNRISQSLTKLDMPNRIE